MQKFLVGLTGMTLFLLAYVRLQVGVISSGYELERLRRHQAELLDQHRVLHYNVLILRSPVILSQRLARRDIVLKPPQQVERLSGEARKPLQVPEPKLPFGQSFVRQAGHRVARWLTGERSAEAEPTV